MDENIVYSSNGAITASTVDVNIGKHTRAFYVMNIGTSPITVTFNNQYTMYIPGTPSTWAAEYYCFPGDYTSYRCNSAASVSVFATA